MSNKLYKKIIVKVGTNVISREDGLVDEKVLKSLVTQIARLKNDGVGVILVSSGAVGAGKASIKLAEKSDSVVTRQVLASVGQIKLINTYSKLFAEHNYHCAQVLATKEDFRDRTHYLNMKNCFAALLHDEIVPIVNENDVTSVSELMFTDNDELAGLIASMMGVDALVILTNVDGVFAGEEVLATIDAKTDYQRYIMPEKSLFGRGGMLTKCNIAEKLSHMGITTHIANGKARDILLDILHGKEVGTKFLSHKTLSSVKRWIAHSDGYEKGVVYINKGAKDALLSKEKATSLLPIGVVKVDGDFEKGDIVRIQTEDNLDLGFGISQYSAQKAREFTGQKGKKPIIHYDYLFLKK
ncbi:glutamate 5-kinase [Candidatus Peregrinibacteria bacterium]|nr:glutamate 5-kinase [Candidatus Peregrinibacteria bacterium]